MGAAPPLDGAAATLGAALRDGAALPDAPLTELAPPPPPRRGLVLELCFASADDAAEGGAWLEAEVEAIAAALAESHDGVAPGDCDGLADEAPPPPPPRRPPPSAPPDAAAAAAALPDALTTYWAWLAALAPVCVCAAACAAVVLCVHERRLRRPPPSARAYVEGMSAARAHRQSLANGSGRGEKL